MPEAGLPKEARQFSRLSSNLVMFKTLLGIKNRKHVFTQVLEYMPALCTSEPWHTNA